MAKKGALDHHLKVGNRDRIADTVRGGSVGLGLGSKLLGRGLELAGR